MAGNNTKMNISYAIKAVDKFTKTHKKLTKQLAQIEQHLEKLEGVHTINIDADTLLAERQLERVEDKVEAIPRRKVITVFLDGWNSFRRKMDTIANFSRDMGEIGQGMAMGYILTAIAPAIQTIAGGLAAIASAGTPAALGIAGLAAVAIPAFTSLGEKYSNLQDAREKLAEASTEKEIAKAMTELTAAQDAFGKTQMESVKALEKFNKFFAEFSKGLEKPVLSIFNKSLETAQNLLTILEPAIEGSAEAVNNLMDAFNRNLEAEDMKAFFEWVNTTAKPNIEKLAKGVGNFIAGFANMMVEFDPLAQSFMDGFLDMSERFREWSQSLSENQAFQDFLTMVKTNAPVVLEHIGQLSTFLWTLIEAMSPFATKVLEISNAILEWATNGLQNNETLSKFVGFMLTAMGVLSAILAPILMLSSMLKAMLGPAFTFVSKHIGTLIKSFTGKLMPTIARVALTLTRFAGGPIGILIQAIIFAAAIIIENWDKIKEWTINAWGKIQEKVGAATEKILGWIEERFPALGAAIRSAMDTTKKNIERAWQFIKDTFENTLKFLKALVKGDFEGMKDAVSDQMDAIWSAVEDIWGNIESYLEGIDLTQIGKDIITGLMNGIKSMAGSLVSAAKGVVGDAIQGAKNLLNINSPSRVFFEFGEFVDQGFINGMLSMTRKVNAASEKMVGSAVPSMDGYGSKGYASKPVSNLGDDLRAGASETNRLLSQLAGQKAQVVIEIKGDNEAIRAYVNEQNAIDAIVRRF